MSSAPKKESNYDKFKKDALVRFLTYDQESLIRRLNLQADENWIYVPFCGREYRISRREPVMEYRTMYNAAMDTVNPAAAVQTKSDEYGRNSDTPAADQCICWKEAESNGVLTICDLLCHTEEPIQLSGTYTTLEGLNRVKGGNASVLGDGYHSHYAEYFNQHVQELRSACEKLGAVPMGKGDAAYRIPLFGSVALQISFYEEDDEFPAQLTFFMDQEICSYLFYETLWYMINLVMDILKEIMELPA